MKRRSYSGRLAGGVGSPGFSVRVGGGGIGMWGGRSNPGVPCPGASFILLAGGGPENAERGRGHEMSALRTEDTRRLSQLRERRANVTVLLRRDGSQIEPEVPGLHATDDRHLSLT